LTDPRIQPVLELRRGCDWLRLLQEAPCLAQRLDAGHAGGALSQMGGDGGSAFVI